jgi:Leucine rich repeat
VTSLTLLCSFTSEIYEIVGSIYECDVQNPVTILDKNEQILRANGSHENYYTDHDVTGFWAEGKIIYYLPRDLDAIFHNLLAFSVVESKLREIARENLKVFVHLRFVSFRDNEIESLERDVFASNPELEVISLKNNRIKFVDGEVFSGPNGLKKLHFDGNLCASRSARSRYDTIGLIAEIREKCVLVEKVQESLKNCEMKIEEKNRKIWELEEKISTCERN